jgi:hypothetical protein
MRQVQRLQPPEPAVGGVLPPSPGPRKDPLGFPKQQQFLQRALRVTGFDCSETTPQQA